MSSTKFLDLSSLEDASDQLKTAIEFSKSDLAKSDVKLFEQFRTSTVQCFEYTYELSVKSIRRFLELTVDNPSQVDEWEFKDLMREAATRGIIDNPTDWFEFRRLRNTSSHAYSRVKADEVYGKAADLLSAAQKMLADLRQRGIAK
jgi:nucleotidyltransferase substrate binding protein (TIGR01987 family)